MPLCDSFKSPDIVYAALRDRSFRLLCLQPVCEFIHDIVFADKRFIHQPCVKGVHPVVVERLDDKLKIPGRILWTAAGGRLRKANVTVVIKHVDEHHIPEASIVKGLEETVVREIPREKTAAEIIGKI